MPPRIATAVLTNDTTMLKRVASLAIRPTGAIRQASPPFKKSERPRGVDARQRRDP